MVDTEIGQWMRCKGKKEEGRKWASRGFKYPTYVVQHDRPFIGFMNQVTHVASRAASQLI